MQPPSYKEDSRKAEGGARSDEATPVVRVDLGGRP
jgi:hypothetical protein